MVSVGSAAPHFDCRAVTAGHLDRLTWEQVHADRTLVLLFHPAGADRLPDYLIAVGNALARAGGLPAGVAVVCPSAPDDLLAWAARPRAEGGPGALSFPLVADPDGHIASLYGLPADGGPLWGQFVIDPSGVVRRMAVSGFPVGPDFDGLLLSVEAIGCPAGAGL